MSCLPEVSFEISWLETSNCVLAKKRGPITAKEYGLVIRYILVGGRFGMTRHRLQNTTQCLSLTDPTSAVRVEDVSTKITM